MSDNQPYRPQFRLDETCTRDDFIFRMEYLLDLSDNPEFQSNIQACIQWANKQPSTAMISWVTDEQGIVHPEATFDRYVNPDGSDFIPD